LKCQNDALGRRSALIWELLVSFEAFAKLVEVGEALIDKTKIFAMQYFITNNSFSKGVRKRIRLLG